MTFPSISEIPEKFRLNEPLFQRDYLINGKLHSWNGPFQEVFSPVSIRDDSGNIAPYLVGHYPMMTAHESVLALEYVTMSNYGHQISVIGQDPGNIAHLINPLVNQVCRLNINSLVAAKSTELNKKIITTNVKEDKSNFLSTDFIF